MWDNIYGGTNLAKKLDMENKFESSSEENRKSITHEEQQRIWDEEHKNPLLLEQMDSRNPSAGVVNFYDFLTAHGLEEGSGLEMGCGKGRNVIWLAEKGLEMSGFDFSPAAIEEAKKRAAENGVAAQFAVGDATKPWDFESDSFDFVIDCFASTDIESSEGREFAAKEIGRVLKPGGYLLAYLLSDKDEYHSEINAVSPGPDKNSFIHPKTGKFEKTFDEDEAKELYGEFKLVSQEEMRKMTEFFGKEYEAINLWCVFQKQ
jgi:SAM-dependent methyltransferase